MPLMLMGGDDFDLWVEAVGTGPAGIQTFYSYRNGPKLAPQLKKHGRDKFFVSTGIPCGCCKYDAPRIEPMTKDLAMGYIDEELQQLQTGYADLLLFHHRCKTATETAAVWEAFEEAKRTGKARHIGVSNFNVHDLKTLQATATLPIEVLEAHFGVGLMDFEVIEFARANNIHIAGFASTSEKATNHPTFKAVVDKVSANHGISSVQTMYAYLHHYNLTVISSCFHPDDPAKCARYFQKDLDIFGVRFTAEELKDLNGVTQGKRTCTDCFTDECQACAHKLQQLGCPLEDRLATEGFPVWGRSNTHGQQCLECAERPGNKGAVQAACGSTAGGETVETMTAKACGI